jgi:acetyl/propionyl-CoA carboxylase alpha subunit
VQYEIEVNGRIRLVTVERAGGRFAVSVDGRTRDVDARRLDGRTVSLIVGPGATYDVGIVPDVATGATGATGANGATGTGMLRVRVGAVECAVALNARRRRGRQDGSDGGLRGAPGPQRLVAPMPGKIVRVAVTPGEAVRARQTVVVIEAMKMENELRAARDGIVGELHAREGALVEAGELLAVVR